ncbi:MAG: hypothetical protein IPM66_19745 [Acidobacteriota bacterium]|nr:MAG: hypothetical protein IPM66_19745 [Acidobacteriota bacterium]
MKTTGKRYDPAGALDRFRSLARENRLDMEAATGLANEAAESVVGDCLARRAYSREAVALLCEMTAHPDPRVARAGLAGLFPSLVERLNDSFDPAACRSYDLIFSQVLDFYRRHPGGAALDAGLLRFGIRDESSMLERKARLTPPTPPADLTSLRKILLLSRVTIGADVLINGTLIAKMRELRPDAEYVLLGSRKLRELYGGDPRIRVHEIGYERGGTVLSRLLSWLDVVAAVEQETAQLNPGEYLLIDPDSRLTQLGLLPLLPGDRSYLYFESRSWPGSGSIGRLASDWLGSLIGLPDPAYPFVALPAEFRASGEAVARAIRRKDHQRIVSISLGVGGNESKRVSDEFEQDLIDRQSDGLILDKGASDEEHHRIDRLVARLRTSGRSVIELNEENIGGTDDLSADVVTWDGGIGRFAGMIAAGNQYIGYDSAGQHIAAALGTPCHAIFVNCNSELFAQRWRPYGRGWIEVESRK